MKAAGNTQQYNRRKWKWKCCLIECRKLYLGKIIKKDFFQEEPLSEKEKTWRVTRGQVAEELWKKRRGAFFVFGKLGLGFLPGRLRSPTWGRSCSGRGRSREDAGHRREDDELRGEGAGSGEQTRMHIAGNYEDGGKTAMIRNMIQMMMTAMITKRWWQCGRWQRGRE